jgi:branched-chain amino acid transport system permease protein
MRRLLVDRMLSGEPPRSRLLGLLVLAVVLALAFAPFLFPGTKPLNVAAKVCVYVVLVASYDLLIGYAGIVSFAHTMFFGIGGYGVAIASARLGAGWVSLGLGLVASLAVSVPIAAAVGLLSLRVKAIFFAMMTLAVASVFGVLASQQSWLTGGEDGLTFRLPAALTPAFRLFEGELLGVEASGRVLSYYLVFLASAGLFLLLLRLVASPFGRVLQAIRDNELRAEALGYRTVVHRTLANAIAAAVATTAGALLALWLRYNGPDTTLGFNIMVDILLMVVIGGMGTLYGAVLGAALFTLAQYYLQGLMAGFAQALAGVPVLPELVGADRWMLWLGVLFIACIYFFPTGIAGRLADSRALSKP